VTFGYKYLSNRLYFCSLDGSVRYLDCESAQFQQVCFRHIFTKRIFYNLQLYHKRENHADSITWMCHTDEQNIVAATNNGDLLFIDCRTSVNEYVCICVLLFICVFYRARILNVPTDDQDITNIDRLAYVDTFDNRLLTAGSGGFVFLYDYITCNNCVSCLEH
jgi:hypothetical protein